MSTKQELLAAEEEAWKALCARFDAIPAGDWEKPGVNGEWSPKDLLAHVAVWNAEAERMLQAFFSTARFTGWPAVDAFNADAYERCREMSLHDVRAMSGAARHRFREECARLTDPIANDIQDMIGRNGHLHYADHFDQLDAFEGSR